MNVLPGVVDVSGVFNDDDWRQCLGLRNIPEGDFGRNVSRCSDQGRGLLAQDRKYSIVEHHRCVANQSGLSHRQVCRLNVLVYFNCRFS